MNAWLERHLEEFVKPVLGSVPDYKPCTPTSLDDYYNWAPKNISTLLECWEEIKRIREGRTLLFAGRDVWEFEILARLENLDSVFRPDISSLTRDYIPERVGSNDPKAGMYAEHFLVDSGVSGSIPRALGVKNFVLILSHVKTRNIFPNIIKTTELPDNERHRFDFLYSLLECSPKYWKRATWNHTVPKGIVQPFSGDDQFRTAAMNTMHIVKAWESNVKVTSSSTRRVFYIRKNSSSDYKTMIRW